MVFKLVLAIAVAVVFGGLFAAALMIRRRQSSLLHRKEAALLQRRADHIFKIALATQVHTRHNVLALTLLQEALRVLEESLRLDPASTASGASLRECRELIDSLKDEPDDIASRELIEYPETELIEAQLHLTEAQRLLSGMEKRGQLSYDALASMSTALKQAQRALDLRLHLRQASSALAGERVAPLERSGEYIESGKDVNRDNTIRPLPTTGINGR